MRAYFGEPVRARASVRVVLNQYERVRMSVCMCVRFANATSVQFALLRNSKKSAKKMFSHDKKSLFSPLCPEQQRYKSLWHTTMTPMYRPASGLACFTLKASGVTPRDASSVNPTTNTKNNPQSNTPPLTRIQPQQEKKIVQLSELKLPD